MRNYQKANLTEAQHAELLNFAKIQMQVHEKAKKEFWRWFMEGVQTAFYAERWTNKYNADKKAGFSEGFTAACMRAENSDKKFYSYLLEDFEETFA